MQIGLREETINDARDRATKGYAYRRLGTKYLKLRDFKKALEYYQLHLSISKDIGDIAEEGIAYSNLGNAYYSLGQLVKALEYHKLHLSIVKDTGDRAGEGNACGNIGAACYSLGQFTEALEYLQLQLSIAREVGDRVGEGNATGNLGLVYSSLCQFAKALEYHQLQLSVAKEVKNRAEEGIACGNLGVDYYSIGDFKTALTYHQLDLSIAKDLGDRVREEKACNDLGIAYYSLSEFDKATEYHKLHLSIAKEIGDRDGEGRATANLGLCYLSLGDFNKALEHNKQYFNSAKEDGNGAEQGKTCANIGIAYYCLGDFNSALEYHQQHLSISKDLGDKAGEGSAYTNLGLVYHSLGNFQEAANYHRRHLNIAIDLGDKAGEGKAYGNLGLAYDSLGDFQKAEENHLLHLGIAQDVGDREGEGKGYGNLGLVHHSLGKYEQAIEDHEKHLAISRDLGDRAGEGSALANIGVAYNSLGEFTKALEYHKLHLSITKEVEDISGEASAYTNLGLAYYSLGDWDKAEEFWKSSVRLQDKIRDLLHWKDDWKISLRNYHKDIYTSLWMLQLEKNKPVEALFTAERGRGQALMDLMKSQYGLELTQSASGKQMEEISNVSNYVSSQTVFIAIGSNAINFWVLQKGKQFDFVQKESDKDLKGLIEEAYQKIGFQSSSRCENRSLDASTEEKVLDQWPDEEGSASSKRHENALKVLHDLVISPISDLIQSGEVTIVPDGPFYFAPFAALQDQHSRYLAETFSIRLIPSLTSLKLMADCTEEHHSTTGALLVGDPWVEEVRIRGEKVKPLPNARVEVEMIGKILQIDPLTGKEATKAAVLSRLNSVALVHIAAHGCAKTGEIVLSPNPTRLTKKPKEKDFLLTMKDVLNAKLRARMVVLSCCHSGRGEIKAEGVVGIARAFLGAGARSVVVSLWAIDDEATQTFMKHFYQHLLEGQSASRSLNQAMKCLRESDNFNDVRFWAPFVLIGDDVTLNFGQTR